LPVTDYLAPLARSALFDDGFCIQSLGMNRAGLVKSIEDWRQNVNGFFNLLALEIWGRLFFFRQSVDEVNEQIKRTAGTPPPGVKTRQAA
jgi:hypothetical protein